MEPISYLGAPIRRWPIVVALALVALIVAAIIPVGSGSAYPPNTWQANSVVALAPPYKANALGAKTGIKQVEFYAHVPAVIAAAAHADGVPLTKSLQSDIVVTKAKKTVAVGGLDVAVLQQSKAGAASLTNKFVAALTTYTQAQLVAQRKNAIATQQAYVAGLEKDIQELPLRAKSTTTPTTTTPTTRPPTVKIKKKIVVKKPATLRHPAPHAVRAGSAALSAAVTGSPPVVLVDTTSTTSSTGSTTTSIAGATTLPTLPGTTATTIPASTTQTTQSLNQKAVQTENRSLAASLANAIAKLSRLQAEGVAPTGIKLITPAHQKSAVLLSTSSALSNVWLRALLGLAIGAVLGVIIAWLFDAFDRRIRTSKRAEEVFGLPVVIEVPAPPTKSVAVVPVVDVVVDPYSPASEAYRRLHVSLLTAPPVTWVKRGYGMQDDVFEVPPRPQELLVGASAPGPSPSPGSGLPGDATTTTQMGLPVPTRPGGQLVATRRKRFAILVTSPGDELTRSLVVVNLAAVFAEAGDRVLVATTGGMRTSFGGNGLPSTWESSQADVSASDLVANARPSQIPGVSSLALGQLFPNPSRLALNAEALVEAAREVVDVILLEAPLLSTQDGSALLPAADLVVVVCEAWHTTVNDGVRSQRLLAQFRPPVLGLVMTNMEARRPSVGAGTSPV